MDLLRSFIYLLFHFQTQQLLYFNLFSFSHFLSYFPFMHADSLSLQNIYFYSVNSIIKSKFIISSLFIHIHIQNSFLVAFTPISIGFSLRAFGFMLRGFGLVACVFRFILTFFISVDQLGYFSAILNCKFTNKRPLHEFAGFLCHPFKKS